MPESEVQRLMEQIKTLDRNIIGVAVKLGKHNQYVAFTDVRTGWTDSATGETPEAALQALLDKLNGLW